jgi:hypothetical protein
MVAHVDPDRLRRLFRERTNLAQTAQRAGREASALTEKYNVLIAEASAATVPHRRMRSEAQARRTHREADAARAEHERRSQDLLRKETEIVDLIAAMVAATETLISADQAYRIGAQLDAIGDRLGRIDGYLVQLTPVLTQLRVAVNKHTELLRSIENGASEIRPAFTAVRAALDQETAAIAAVKAVADGTAGNLDDLRQELGHQSEALRAIGAVLTRRLPSGEPPQPIAIVQEGWSPDEPPITEPRATDLPTEIVAALPEQTTVLLFASQPRDKDPVDLAEEIRQVHQRIDEAEFGAHIMLRAWLATQPLDLLPNLNRHQPHMVQFSGHGHADGVLLTGPHGRAEPVATDRLIQMFRWSCQRLRIIFFNVCDSTEHALAAARLVDAAIGMDGKMHDEAARTFAAQLYSALAFGHSLKRAYHQACAFIGDQPDALVPQIFFRDGIDPHKVVLVRPPGM